MEPNSNLIEPLLERVEAYSKTSIALLKLKTLDKTSDITATIISRLFLGIFFTLFILTLTIALALWIGSILGKNYYGFIIVSLFYGLICIALLLFHPPLKKYITNSIIKQVLN